MSPIQSLPSFNYDTVSPLQRPGPVDLGTGSATPDGSVSTSSGFAQSLTSAIGSLSGLQENAGQAVAGLATNQGVDIHQAMLAMDQASLGMHLAVQVRDKAVEAYQSLINMQL